MSKELEISQKIAESEDASGSDSKDTKLLESKSSDVKKVFLRDDGMVWQFYLHVQSSWKFICLGPSRT